jgi:dTDP-4-amino-4,6-dideoxygalactose transaminase
MRIPLFDTKTPLAPLNTKIRAKIDEILDRGSFILGPEVAAFEKEFAGYLGAKHAIGVANGTEAITIALRALGVGPGDEVVVPSFTFYASAEAIGPTGATPVFCDVDPETFCVTAETVKAALTPKTKAVIAVHLFGNVAPIDEISALGLPVLEDSAQSAGSIAGDGRRPGALGAISTFSFFPSKNLGCFGDGGAVVTNDEQLAERISMLRFHGSKDKTTFEMVGFNSRLDEIQAGILRVILPELDRWSDGRREGAAAYEDEGLGELVDLPLPVDGAQPAWHLYVIKHAEIDRIADSLQQAGIGQKAYYRVPTHKQPAMREWGATAELPATDEVARTHLAIPLSPVFTQDQARSVVEVVREAVGERSQRRPAVAAAT